MTALIRPDADRYEDWAQALREFGAETAHGSGLWETPGGTSRETFAAHLEASARFADPGAELPAGKVHAEQYWILDGAALVGFLHLRRETSALVVEEIGHIGYSVRPSRRREGHASRALGLALSRAREVGIDRVVVTCDEDNLASARTIESQGGVMEDVRKGRRRYWIDTAGR